MGGLGPSGTSSTASVVILLLVAALVFGGLGYMAYKHGHPSFGSSDTSSGSLLSIFETTNSKDYNFEAVYPHDDPPPRTPVLRVFFVGDNYTLANNMPALLTAIAASDVKTPVDIKTGVFAASDATLGELWEEGSGRRALSSLRWNFVVLQDMGLLPISPAGAAEMYGDVKKWDIDAKKIGAHTVVYETWARKPGSAWYTDKKKYPTLNLGTPESMQDKIYNATNWVAADIGAGIVPVGDYVAACRDMPGMPDFYYDDGNHPSLAGDYMIALLFYHGLTGHRVGNVTYVPDGLTPDDVRLLKKCVAF